MNHKATPLVFLCLTLTTVVALAQDVPVPQKSLSAWLDDYGAGPRHYHPSPSADEAVRRAGASAVPLLLELLRKTNSPAVDEELRQIGAGTRTGTNTPNFIPASWYHWQAYLGFQALEPAAESAIPDLAALAHADPNGTSFYPNIDGMKHLAWVAASANNSSSYVTLSDGPAFDDGTARHNTNHTKQFYLGPSEQVMRDTKPFLVDGEIAAWSLAAIGADAVPSLMTLLDDPSPHLKQRAVEALGIVGSAAEPAVPAIIKNLQGDNFEVRQRAADALGWIGRRPDLTIPALIAALNDSDVGVCYYAAESLGRFGSRATNAIPALLSNVTARDYRLRQSAVSALGRISPEITAREVVPGLFRQLEDPSGYHNEVLIDLLQLNLPPDQMIPRLLQAMDERDGNDQSVQMNVMQGLGKYGPAAQVAVPQLLKKLADANYFMREHATNALNQIEPAWQSNYQLTSRPALR